MAVYSRYGSIYQYNYGSTCDHKKRQISTRPQNNVSLEAEQLFKSIDINGNNAINMEEANSYINNSTRFKRSSSFAIGQELRIIDTNNDGIISPDEFDVSLKL